MTTTANILHAITGIACLSVAFIRIPRWRDVATRAMTVTLVALSALMFTNVAYNLESDAPGPSWYDAFSYACAVTVSVSLIYLAARAWSFTGRQWLTHTAAVVAGGVSGAYISIVIHFRGDPQDQFLITTTACVAGFAGLLLFVASLAAGVERGVPAAARWSLLILATASLLWAIGAARRFGDNAPWSGGIIDVMQLLPWESVSWAALLFAASATLGMYLPWKDDAPLKPELEAAGIDAGA
ncbi:hypothetical protein [Nocardia sp. NPDC004722]